MKLGQLLQAIEHLMPQRLSPASIPDTDVRSLAYDSRQVETGALFVGLQGLKTAGVNFAADAIARGAIAVVAEQPPASPVGGAWVEVADARAALALLAAEFNGHPSRAMSVVGITGTNGKTTTAYLLRSVFEERVKSAGCSAPSLTRSATRSCRPPGPHRRHQTCRGCFAGWWTAVAARA